MTAIQAFTIRPLERKTPDNALEGAFRVHISDKDLKALTLSRGDLLRLSLADGPRGFGIAWNAVQTNPGNKPIAKVTDLLRDKYGLTLQDRPFIEKANEHWKAIDSVEISFIGDAETLSRFGTSEELLYWARYALVDIEIIHAGCTIDIHQKGPGSSEKIRKIRATIQNVEPKPDLTKALYFDPIKSNITAMQTPPAKPSATLDQIPQLDECGIGGLSSQIATINESLALLNNPAFVFPDHHLLGPTAFLIHGPEGTGKSLLLERLSQSAWHETFQLDATSSPKTPIKDLIDTFDKARNAQPSLILMDEINKFLAKAEALVTQLRSELKKLEGTKVVVVAASRSVYDVDASLRTASAFKNEVELFPPNVKQREDTLRQIIGLNRLTGTVELGKLAERTHGFVGRDLHKLCGLARNHRVQAVYQSLDAEKKASFVETLQAQDFVTQTDFDAVIDQVQPTVLKDSILEVPKVRWTDIAGLGHVQELLEAIMIRPFKVPDLDIKFGGPQSRKGVLLYGPPGCAKTLIAQAVATESNQNFLAVKGSELIKMYVGESERAIRDIFRRARAARPCIIFFDEIDSIGKSREKSQDSGLNVVATLLNEMDGIEALKEVFIIGATNRPDILDSALIRTGRFDAHIHIGLPSEDARRQIFEIHTRKRPLAGDVDLSMLASKTEGSSGADIKGLCSVALEMAISDYTQDQEKNKPEVRMCHFQRALDQHIPHTIKEEAARYEGWRPGKSLSAD